MGPLQLPARQSRSWAWFSMLRGYILLGLSVFAGIMVALSIAVILGAFAEDLKSVQIIITPLMMVVLLPYLITMFIDINTASPVLKWLIYAIPFSHPFLAAQFIFAQNFTMVVAGHHLRVRPVLRSGRGRSPHLLDRPHPDDEAEYGAARIRSGWLDSAAGGYQLPHTAQVAV